MTASQVAAAERVEVAVAVAVQVLGLREQARVRLAAVEERQLVAAAQRLLGGGAPEELGAAEEQEPHPGNAIGGAEGRAA